MFLILCLKLGKFLFKSPVKAQVSNYLKNENTFFLLFGAFHVGLVLLNVFFNVDVKLSDDIRYLAVAREILSFDLSAFDPVNNCVTAPGYSIFLAITSFLTHFNPIGIALLQALLFLFSAYKLIFALAQTNFIRNSMVKWYLQLFA